MESLIESDLIYYIKDGQLVIKGKYEEVLSKIELIKKKLI